MLSAISLAQHENLVLPGKTTALNGRKRTRTHKPNALVGFAQYHYSGGTFISMMMADDLAKLIFGGRCLRYLIFAGVINRVIQSFTVKGF